MKFKFTLDNDEVVLYLECKVNGKDIETNVIDDMVKCIKTKYTNIPSNDIQELIVSMFEDVIYLLQTNQENNVKSLVDYYVATLQKMNKKENILVVSKEF